MDREMDREIDRDTETQSRDSIEGVHERDKTVSLRKSTEERQRVKSAQIAGKFYLLVLRETRVVRKI